MFEKMMEKRMLCKTWKTEREITAGECGWWNKEAGVETEIRTVLIVDEET